MSPSPIHWLRVLIGGVLAEAAVFVIVIPVLLTAGQRPLLYVAPIASLLMCFLLAIWVGRRVESHFVLHGVLVGIVATLIYVALTRAKPEPSAYILAHALKILGGAAGGFFSARKKVSAVEASPSTD